MRIGRLCAGLIAAWLACTAACAATLVDDRGRRLALAAPAQRIVALAPHLTELVYAVGAGKQLVGVDSASDFPAAAQSLPKIGDASRLDFERMLQLKPDLVLAWKSGNRAADVAQLERLGIAVFVSETGRLPDIARVMRSLGDLSGNGASAEVAARNFEAQLDALKARYQTRRKVSVFYQIWFAPLMTVNGAHIISDALALCGGRNIFESLPQLTPMPALEAVLQADPQAIIVADGAPQGVAEWLAFPRLRAVRAQQVFSVPPDLLHRAGPRMLQGVAELCDKIDRAR